MRRIFTNGPQRDYVANALSRLLHASQAIFLAAPYYDHPTPVLDAARAGKRVQLLIGLNGSTSPEALEAAHAQTGVQIRYLTQRFHAKIYVFDDAALLGSANLTNAGLHANREAVICLDQEFDRESIEEVRALFAELWDSAAVLTTDVLKAFKSAMRASADRTFDRDAVIEEAVGRVEPVNINVASRQKSREQLFMEGLRREIYEQYRPAFQEVSAILLEAGSRRPELSDVGLPYETNRFLNWVRLVHAPDEASWRDAPLLGPDQRRGRILELAAEWRLTSVPRIQEDYVRRLQRVQKTLGDAAALAESTQETLSDALTGLHAFEEQLRFVRKGQLMPTFWKENANDLVRVRETLHHLLFGSGDFIIRLHDILYDPRWKLSMFGRFCALELFGTVHPDLYPPINGRMVKALRHLGFDVKGV